VIQDKTPRDAGGHAPAREPRHGRDEITRLRIFLMARSRAKGCAGSDGVSRFADGRVAPRSRPGNFFRTVHFS
jgi:hypothetical protein